MLNKFATFLGDVYAALRPCRPRRVDPTAVKGNPIPLLALMYTALVYSDTGKNFYGAAAPL